MRGQNRGLKLGIMEEDCGISDQSIGVTGSGTKVRDFALLGVNTYLFLSFLYWVFIGCFLIL